MPFFSWVWTIVGNSSALSSPIGGSVRFGLTGGVASGAAWRGFVATYDSA
jgi:hypothetical protein